MDVCRFAMQMEKDGEAYYRECASKTASAGLSRILLPTPWGPVSVRISRSRGAATVRVDAAWRGAGPTLAIMLPGFRNSTVAAVGAEQRLESDPG